MSSSPGRRGVVLPVVAFLILLIASGVFMLQRTMRQRYLEAHRLTFGEVALALAESGANVALENLGESVLDPDTEIYTVLVTTTVDQINGVSIPIPAPQLDALAELFQGAAEADVSLEFRNFQPFYPEQGLRGVARDPREKFGEVAVVSRATFRGVTRTFHAARRVKVVDVAAPVLSKFTLFVKERAGQDPNLLVYDRNRPHDGFRVDGEPASPLVLFHREERFPAVEGGRFLPLGPVLSDVPVDGGGLVFLGGPRPWYLNLVHGYGAGRYEELFQLRRARYRVPSDLPEVSNEYGLTFGFYEDILRSGKFGGAAAPGGSYPRPGGGLETVTDATAALHLYGDVSNVSPTVVLGPVFRSYVSLTLLDGLWYPYRSASEFSGVAGAGPFGGSYETYARVMCRVVHEAYNRAHDYVTTNTELLGEDGLVTGEGTPWLPEARLVGAELARVRPARAGDDTFLYPHPDEEAAGRVHLVRDLDGVEETVFRGALEDIDGALMESLLVGKAVHAAEDGAAFLEEYVDAGKLSVPGIVHVVSGDLELGRVRVQEPGMVLVQGNVRITGAIEAEDGAAPFTVVSLGGDVRIATGDPVRASLVALRGRVTGGGRLDLRGALAARTLDLRSMVRGEEPKELHYDPALDPTRGESYLHRLRAILDDRLVLSVERH